MEGPLVLHALSSDVPSSLHGPLLESKGTAVNTTLGLRKSSNAENQLISDHPMEHDQHERRRVNADERSARAHLRNSSSRMKESIRKSSSRLKESIRNSSSSLKESIRPRCSKTKTSALNDVLYAEISTAEMYIYDPQCHRCNKMMARTRTKNKHTKKSKLLSHVEKRKPKLKAYLLRKMQPDCYVGKVQRDVRLRNQSLSIAGGNSDINIIEPKKDWSCSYPNTSRSSLRSRLSSSMESDNQPMSIPYATDQHISERQAKSKRRRVNADERSAKVDLRNSKYKEAIRTTCSKTKASASNKILYAEIRKSDIYIYDPHCHRCNKMMAKTRGNKKHTKRSKLLTLVEKRKPRSKACVLKKMQSDCYVGKVRGARIRNQSLKIAGFESKIIEPKKVDSTSIHERRTTPNASKSSLRLGSSLEVDHQPMEAIDGLINVM